uniref:Uncharacterized protein n=1 Tax=Moniliophthora roreri TaxID=221103 RepID=A0A0W0F952_MONRR
MFDATESIKYVPSLLSICIRILADYPDQVHHLPQGFALSYRPSTDISKFDILKALIPSYSTQQFSLGNVHPCLWATLIQLYPNSLPPSFGTYRIPFYDSNIPIIHQVPSTPTCSIVTILELPGCSELTDETISKLRVFHGLVALDASETKLSSLGVSRLASTCLWHGTERKGPWRLRILRLRDYLRGTAIHPSNITSDWQSPAPSPKLYHPVPLTESLSLLEEIAFLFNSSSVYRIHVDRLNHTDRRSAGTAMRCHPPPSGRVPHGLCEDTAFTFTSPSTSTSPGADDRYDVETEVSPINTFVSKVAAEEASEHRKRRSLIDFYGIPASVNPLPVDTGYSAQRHYRLFREKLSWPTFADSPHCDHRTNLMIYRPPPPCSLLDQTCPPSSPPESRTSTESQNAVVNKNHARMLAMVAQQREAAVKRGRLNHGMAYPDFGSESRTKACTSAEPSSTKSRNPFRKSAGSRKTSSEAKLTLTIDSKSVSAYVITADGRKGHSTLGNTTPSSPPSPKFSSSTSHGLLQPAIVKASGTQRKVKIVDTSSKVFPGQASVSGTSPNADSGVPCIIPKTAPFSTDKCKRLKPISTIPVPELPENEKLKLKEAAMREETLIAKERAKAQVAHRRSLPGHEAQGDIRKMMKRMASADNPKPRTSVHGAPSGSGSVVVENGVVSGGPVKKKPRHAGFDWSSWGKG